MTMAFTAENAEARRACREGGQAMNSKSYELFQQVGEAATVGAIPNADLSMANPETAVAVGRSMVRALIVALAPEIETVRPPARACEDACPLFRSHCSHSCECVADLGRRRDWQCGVRMEPGPDCPMNPALSAPSAVKGDHP